MKGRVSFQRTAVYHIYQNTVNGHLIFYSARDYIILFTYISLAALRAGVTIIGLCLMPDHIHILVRAESAGAISRFVNIYTSGFVKEYNGWYGRKGPLFNAHFGRAPKIGGKKIRTALAYLYNNPVEKNLSRKAEDYQWNFLAYTVSDYPFSQKTPQRRCRGKMRDALALIKAMRSGGKPLRYALLEECTAGLTEESIRELTDRIICCYNCIDYNGATRYYDNDYGKMILAFSSNTGSEYDITEIFTPGSDAVYYKMAAFIIKVWGRNGIKKIFSMDEVDKIELGVFLAKRTGANKRQLEKFLRIER